MYLLFRLTITTHAYIFVVSVNNNYACLYICSSYNKRDIQRPIYLQLFFFP